jgi:hypothetical protein
VLLFTKQLAKGRKRVKKEKRAVLGLAQVNKNGSRRTTTKELLGLLLSPT